MILLKVGQTQSPKTKKTTILLIQIWPKIKIQNWYLKCMNQFSNFNVILILFIIKTLKKSCIQYRPVCIQNRYSYGLFSPYSKCLLCNFKLFLFNNGALSLAIFNFHFSFHAFPSKFPPENFVSKQVKNWIQIVNVSNEYFVNILYIVKCQ